MFVLRCANLVLILQIQRCLAIMEADPKWIYLSPRKLCLADFILSISVKEDNFSAPKIERRFGQRKFGGANTYLVPHHEFKF